MSMCIKKIKTFLDGSVLWVELHDPDTDETTIMCGGEYETWKKTGSTKQGENGETKER